MSGGSTLRNAHASRLGRLRAVLAGLSAAMLLALPASPAGAQTPANPATERVSALTDPGVVFITTVVGWSVRLTFADNTQISGRNNIDRQGRLNYSSGSGFVVNPNGVIITASHVIEPDEQQIKNYAANQIFFTGGLGYRLKSGDNPYEKFSISDNRFYNDLLQQCYSGVACSFSIKPEARVYSPVQIAGTSAPKPMTARVLQSTGFEGTDVAVLQVDGNNMPTVPLANTAGNLTSGQEVTGLGFAGSVQDLPTGVTEPTKAFGRVSSVRSAGSSKVVQVDMRIEGGMSGGPVVDGSGQVIGLTSFSFTEGTTRTQGFLRTVDDIKATLQGAGATIARGDVDKAYAAGLELFWGRHYSVAIPEFQNALNLYDGHPGAKRYLSQAQAKAGTPEDLPVEEPDEGLPVAAIAGGLGAALVLIAGLIVLLIVLRKRKGSSPAPAAPAGWGQPNAPLANGPGPQAPGTGQPMAHTAPLAPPSEPPTWGPAEPEPERTEGVPRPIPGELSRIDPVPAPTGATAVSAGAEASGAAETTPIAAVEEPPAAAGGKRFCSNCGTEQSPGTKFCSSCGNNLG
jgi:S1-C subfamily serine protease